MFYHLPSAGFYQGKLIRLRYFLLGDNMFDRLEKLIGNVNLDKIKASKVLLVGVGGVGGICLESLVRSGFNDITVVDYDTFEESNLNRQLLCNINVINKKKVLVAASRAKLINPNINIKTIDIFLDESTIEKLGQFDYIIDACDSTLTKIALIKYAYKNNIKIISSMGMGNRMDPEKVKICKLSQTQNDPLAKKVRSLLKKEKIDFDPMVVSSFELPKKGLNVISSFMPVVSVSGIYMASFVINDILKK